MYQQILIGSEEQRERRTDRKDKESDERSCKIFIHSITLPRLMPDPKSLIDKKDIIDKQFRTYQTNFGIVS